MISAKSSCPFGKRNCLRMEVKKRRRAGQLSTREIMTIIIYFHQYRNRYDASAGVSQSGGTTLAKTSLFFH
jgi:hypothetical protein